MMNKETKITYVNNISVEDYNALRKSVNWINVTEKRAVSGNMLLMYQVKD